MLTAVGADYVADRPIQSISGGELQRVLLARALLRNPDLLVLDEPVQGVDVGGQTELYALIRRLRDDRGCGVLMVSRFELEEKGLLEAVLHDLRMRYVRATEGKD